MGRMDDHISRLSEKLQLLLKRYQALEKENEKLKHELGQRLQEEKLLQEKMSALEQESAIVKAASDGAGKNELEKRINGYIREIDQCIALLASQ